MIMVKETWLNLNYQINIIDAVLLIWSILMQDEHHHTAINRHEKTLTHTSTNLFSRNSICGEEVEEVYVGIDICVMVWIHSQITLHQHPWWNTSHETYVLNTWSVPGKNPGTSTKVKIGMLNESRNRTNLAAFTEESMSRHPAKCPGLFATTFEIVSK